MDSLPVQKVFRCKRTKLIRIQKVKDLKEKKNLSFTEIAKVMDISRNIIYKVLKNELGYVSNRLVKNQSKETD